MPVGLRPLLGFCHSCPGITNVSFQQFDGFCLPVDRDTKNSNDESKSADDCKSALAPIRASREPNSKVIQVTEENAQSNTAVKQQNIT
jgi:hypothetical protein